MNFKQNIMKTWIFYWWVHGKSSKFSFEHRLSTSRMWSGVWKPWVRNSPLSRGDICILIIPGLPSRMMEPKRTGYSLPKAKSSQPNKLSEIQIQATSPHGNVAQGTVHTKGALLVRKPVPPDTHVTSGFVLAGLLSHNQAWKISHSRAHFLDTVHLPLPRESQLDIIENVIK